jgi:hypothetical protein
MTKPKSIHLVTPPASRTPVMVTITSSAEDALARLGALGFELRPMGSDTFGTDEETLLRLVELLDRLLARVT